MTAESTPSVNRQPMGSQQIRIAVLVVVAVVVGVVLYLVLRPSGKHKPKANTVATIGPIGFIASHLKEESQYIHTKFFWAGPQQGYTYEFFRKANGYIDVRYLPAGVRVGVKHARYLIIATYPIAGAYAALKHVAKSNAVPGPGGSIVFVRPGDHKSVLMAFPGIDDQIEVWDPKPAVAIATAESGKIKPVR